MSAFPHRYRTTSSASSDSLLHLEAEGRESIKVSAPPQFGGPKGYWTPEDFYSASISTCFILTFKFLARVQKIDWENISVQVDSFLDKTSQGLMFNKVLIKVKLNVLKMEQKASLERLVQKAKAECLITKSLSEKTEVEVSTEIYEIN